MGCKQGDKMAKRILSWEERYALIDSNIGEGGNADVSLVEDKETGIQYALKVLREGGVEKKTRFVEEINIMKDNWRNIKGIMPIYDYSTEEHWYVMPTAKPITEYIREEKLGLEDIINLSIRLAQVLELLHEKQISHRDIKPSNIYYLDEDFVFGDFGLVDFPENENDFTRSDKGLGAIFTIAPEMKRDPKHADGKKADVFSFAKTLWMFLTLDEKGFDGTYNYADDSFALRYNSKYEHCHLVELEELLTNATDNNAERRPTIKDFTNCLMEYLEILRDDEKAQISDWRFLSENLFGKSEPKSSCWEQREKIVDVLNIIGMSPAYNHMFFSSKGGLDFKKAEVAPEDGCIYIYDTSGGCAIMKPSSLYYEGFSDDSKWNYFLLELSQLKPIEKRNYDYPLEYEFLVEDKPSHYVSAQAAQYGVYDYESGKPLPKGFKLVRRYLSGKILVVLKYGLYNAINATYDGRHGMCSPQQFRKYIEEMVKFEKKAYEEGLDAERVLNHFFHKNPFEKEIDNKEHVENRIRRRKEAKEFIEKNFNEWKFINGECKGIDEQAILRFRFRFRLNSSRIEFLDTEHWNLCKDGYFKKVTDNSDDIYYVDSREVAKELCSKFEQMISEKCEAQGIVNDSISNYIVIDFERIGKPIHLFTSDELYPITITGWPRGSFFSLPATRCIRTKRNSGGSSPALPSADLRVRASSFPATSARCPSAS